MNEKKFGFEKFEVCQISINFNNRIIVLTKNFPRKEQYGLCFQLKKAALSITLNIAEGYSNYYKNDKIRYYRIACGSTHECVPSLTISRDQEFITKYEYRSLYNECYELSKMISGSINSISKYKNIND